MASPAAAADSLWVNGNRITLLDAGGKTILTVTLGLDGKYQVALDGVLDQPVPAPTASAWGCKYRALTLTGTRATLAPSIFISPTAPCPRWTQFPHLVEDSDWSTSQSLRGDLNITAGADPLVNIAFDASQPGLRGLHQWQRACGHQRQRQQHQQHGQRPECLHVDAGSEQPLRLHLNQPLDRGGVDNPAQGGLHPHGQRRRHRLLDPDRGHRRWGNPVISAVTGTEMTEANQGDGAVVRAP